MFDRHFRSNIQLLLVEIHAADDVHARALVETRRPGGTLGIDSEYDAGETAPVELGERMSQQGLADASPPPRTTHAEQIHDAAVGSRLARSAERETGDLLVLAGKEPEGRIEPLALDRPMGPLLVRLFLRLPRVDPRLAESAVYGATL